MPLISESYRKQQSELHEGTLVDGERKFYGGAAITYAPLVAEVINKVQPFHVLDYGCGKHLVLAKALQKAGVKHRFKYQAYDPAVEKFASSPVPADMVVCIDVLEHVEEECIDDVLDHLRQLTEGVGVFTICTGPARKNLPDGRNAHVLQKPPEWWLPRIMCRFDLQTFQVISPVNFYVIVTAQVGALEDADGKKLS